MKSYIDLLRDVLENGEPHADRTGVGTRSVFGRQWRHDLQTGFPLLTTKKLPLRWVFEELRWFLSGSNRVEPLQTQGVDIWDEWATLDQCSRFGRQKGDLGPIYGPLWRNFGASESGYCGDQPATGSIGFDQLAWLLTEIRSNPNSRRLIVSGWHPWQQTRVALPPCHTLWQIKCHGDTGEMSLHLYARSIDIFLGLPFNIASYALLLKMLACVTGHVARDLIISFGDLHLYNNHVAQAVEQTKRYPRNCPNVYIIPNSQTGQPIERLLSIEWKNITLADYDPHPAIKADVAV